MITKLKTVFKTDDFLVFLITMLTFGIGVGLFAGVMNNYLAEILHINRFERGLVEFVRELPGLSLIFLLALLYKFSETRIIRVALLFGFAGLAGLFFSGTERLAGIGFVVLWSLGEHLIMPVRQSIAIHSAQPGHHGRAMGVTGSFGNLGQVLGFYMVPLIFWLLKRSGVADTTAEKFIPFQAVFLVAGVFLLLALLSVSRFPKSTHHIKKQRLFIRRKYWRYYVLEMFFGARKQVFMTFAPFVLILNYNASTALIATLYGIYSLINIFLSPLMGKLVDRIGYKIILIIDAVVLILMCVLYGFSHHLFPEQTAFIVVAIVFVIDGMLFVVGMARSLYAKSISTTQAELTATLSTGISVNHFFSIIIALLGGLLWERLGIELLFMSAAFFGIGALIFSSFLPKPALEKSH